MKLKRSVIFSVPLLIMVLVLLAHVKYVYRDFFPNSAWNELIPTPVPNGLKLTGYTWKYTDNLFHISQYFLLEGSEEKLIELASNLNLGLSQDAMYSYPNEIIISGVKLSQYSVKYGYEGAQNRNDWYWLVKERPIAIYERN
jgi:hypothetical protein